MDRDLWSVEFTEKVGFDKRVVPKIAGTGVENMMWVVGWWHRCDLLHVLKLATVWLEK